MYYCVKPRIHPSKFQNQPKLQSLPLLPFKCSMQDPLWSQVLERSVISKLTGHSRRTDSRQTFPLKHNRYGQSFTIVLLLKSIKMPENFCKHFQHSIFLRDHWTSMIPFVCFHTLEKLHFTESMIPWFRIKLHSRIFRRISKPNKH